MVKKILSFRGKVELLEPGKIPKIYMCKIVSSKKDVEANMEIHEDFKIINSGDRVLLELLDGRPRRMSEKDFVGKGYLFKITRENNRVKYIFSIGGFILTILTKEEIEELKVDREFYVRVHKL